MFTKFKKKDSPKKQRRPLTFPVLDQADLTTEKVSDLLTSGIPIWTWYNVADRLEKGENLIHENEFFALEHGYMDGFSMYRIEGDYLCKYVAELIGETPDLCLRIDTIWPYNPLTVYEVFHEDLKAAYEVSYDPEHRTDNLMGYAHDLDEDKIAAYLHDHPAMHVGPEHFKKREN